MSFHLFVYHWILEFTFIFSRFCWLGSLIGHCDFLSVQPDIFFYVSVKSLFYLCFFRVLLSSDWNLEWGGVVPPFYFPLGPPILRCRDSCLETKLPILSSSPAVNIRWTKLSQVWLMFSWAWPGLFRSLRRLRFPALTLILGWIGLRI